MQDNFLSADLQASTEERPALRLVRTIALPGVTGRLDRVAVDPDKKRLFAAAVTTGRRHDRPDAPPGHLAQLVMDDKGALLACDSLADLIYQFDTRKRELIRSWPVRGDGAADLALDGIRHRLFVGTRMPPKITVYDSLSGKEVQSLPAPETMDGVYYDTQLKRIYMTGGRWYGTPDASPGWIYVYQQRDADHYDLISKIKTRPGSGTSLFVPQLNAFHVASQAIDAQKAAILVFEPVP